MGSALQSLHRLYHPSKIIKNHSWVGWVFPPNICQHLKSRVWSDQTSWIIAWSPPSPTAWRHVATVVKHWRCFRCSVKKKHFLGGTDSSTDLYDLMILSEMSTFSWTGNFYDKSLDGMWYHTCGQTLMMSNWCIALARVWQFIAFREQTNIYPKQPSALILIPCGNSGNLTLQWKIPAFNGNSWDI